MSRSPAAEAPMVEHIRAQARACAVLGSPFYATLLGHLADAAAAGGVVDLVAGLHELPQDALLSLRLLGTVHGMVLAGTAPELAEHYPSTGGDGDADAVWPAFLDLLATRTAEVRAGLDVAPQTNEAGRASALMGGLLAVAGQDPLPVRLWEIGASGGLNLRADLFQYVATDRSTWGGRAHVVLDPAWDTLPAGAPASLQVVERVGCDLAPVDVATDDGALRLQSYVWPDQVARLDRLRRAIDTAREHPVDLRTSGAAEFVDELDLTDGTLTVLWHSVMWQYLDASEQARVLTRVEELAAGASASGPLAHVSFEPHPEQRHRFVVATRTWPGGVLRILGEAPPHGMPVTWNR